MAIRTARVHGKKIQLFINAYKRTIQKKKKKKKKKEVIKNVYLFIECIRIG